VRRPTQIYGNTIDFVWGVVVEVHEVGPYSIVEHLDKEDHRIFHPYVEGRDTNCGCTTIEGALLQAMAVKHIGHNTDFSFLACRALGVYY